MIKSDNPFLKKQINIPKKNQKIWWMIDGIILKMILN